MKWSNELMSNVDVQISKIGTETKRSARNKWAEEVGEAVVRRLCPWPISYDVSCLQPTNFGEFAYTEFSNGIVVTTQSKEINARLYHFASMVEAKDTTALDQFTKALTDKYVLEDVPARFKDAKRVVFMPGHNMLDVVSHEILTRLYLEDEDIYVKPHPICLERVVGLIAKKVGWQRIIPKDASGFRLLFDCDEVYTTSCSEMSITGTALGKKVFNISNVHNEGAGTYHALARLIFKAHEKHGVEEAKRILNNVLSCEWSGYVFPWHSEEEVEHRLKCFYAKSFELREMYKPLTLSIGNLLTGAKPVPKEDLEKQGVVPLKNKR